MDELSETPLRGAVEADRAASQADEAAAAAQHWDDALDAYAVVLELDWGADERRFAGDPDQIRERLGEVVEKLVSARRSAATKARRAGDWYVGAEQYEIAIEEFEAAKEQYERALDVAYDRYPDATDHLAIERDAIADRLERARASRDGETVEPAETADDAGTEPSLDFEATIGDGGAVETATDGGDSTAVETDVRATDAESAGTDREVDGDAAGDDVGVRLRGLDRPAFVDVVRTVLSETGWTADPASDDAGYDVEATKETPTDERMLVRIAHQPDDGGLSRAVVDDCAALQRDRPDVDAVMVATSGSVTDDRTRHARQQAVRLLDEECLSAVVESRDLDDVLPDRLLQAE
jgi:hypothetical protein